MQIKVLKVTTNCSADCNWNLLVIYSRFKTNSNRNVKNFRPKITLEIFGKPDLPRIPETKVEIFRQDNLDLKWPQNGRVLFQVKLSSRLSTELKLETSERPCSDQSDRGKWKSRPAENWRWWVWRVSCPFSSYGFITFLVVFEIGIYHKCEI